MSATDRPGERESSRDLGVLRQLTSFIAPYKVAVAGAIVALTTAAATVLAKAGKPMRSREMITAMAEQGLWTSPKGKTPHATLYAAMMREARNKGTASRFRKTDRGQFAINAKAKA